MVLLGYEVPPDDVKLETVNLTAVEMSEIMNLATKHGGEQYTMCLKGRKFSESVNEITNYVKIVTDKSSHAKNLLSMVNLYAHVGRTSLPGSSRLDARHTEHHLGYVKYAYSCNVRLIATWFTRVKW